MESIHGGGNILFFQITVPILLLFFIGFIIYLNVREIFEWHQSTKLPISTEQVNAVRKRSQVIHHMHQFEIHLYYPSSSYYFVTFENQHGKLIELEMNEMEYSQIAEGDIGVITYQGKILLEFARIQKG